jgi:hypothetical protein
MLTIEEKLRFKNILIEKEKKKQENIVSHSWSNFKINFLETGS